MSAPRRARTFALFAGLGIAMATGCSLGLDESKIGEASSDAGSEPDTAPAPTDTVDGSMQAPDTGAKIDAGTDAGMGTTCTKDADCNSTDPCLKGRCDVPRSACVYDVCPTTGTTCSAAICSQDKCGTATPYKFASAKVTVPSGYAPGCPSAQKCTAAVFPWVFIATAAGVLAYPATPVDPNPAPVLVSDISFSPSQLIASGNRVWALGATTSTGLNRTQIAYVDVPQSALVKTIGAHAALATNNQTRVDYIFPAPSDAALLVSALAMTPAGITAAPFGSPPVITENATNLALSATPSATSGTRLLAFTPNSGATTFSLVAGAGTMGPTASNLDGTSLGQVAATPFFATAPDGSILLHVASVTGLAPNLSATTKVIRVIDSATATTLGTTFNVVTDTFTAQASISQFTGPVAPIDATSFLAVSAAVANPSGTSHLQWVDNKGTMKKVLALSVPATSVATVTSAGFGWTVTADAATSLSLYMIAPGCSM